MLARIVLFGCNHALLTGSGVPDLMVCQGLGCGSDLCSQNPVLQHVFVEQNVPSAL